MRKIVLDASTAIDWFVPSVEGEAYSVKLVPLVKNGSVGFVVPLHFDVEVTGHLVKKTRQKPEVFTAAWLNSCLELMDVLPIEITAQGLNYSLLGKLAKSYNLTVYDAPYFHLARMLELPIASRDKGIVSACKHWDVLRWTP